MSAPGLAALMRPVVDAAGRWRLRRGADGRVSFPYVARRAARGFLVLVYHRVGGSPCPFFPGMPPTLFERQMELLATTHRVLPLEELMDRSRRGDLPPGAVAVTFDDGYDDVREHAAPILRRHGVPATVFLATGPLDGGEPLWHDAIFSAFRRADRRPLRVEGSEYPMETLDDRRAALTAFLHRARRDPPEARRQRIRSLYEERGLDGDDPERPRMLTWDGVAALVREGISFGAHTVTHPVLSGLSPAEARDEIVRSKEAIERRLGGPVRLFAYPNGGPGDFDAATKGILRDAGFDGAMTTIWGANDATTDPYELRRVRYWGSDPVRGLARLAWYRVAG